MPDLLLRYEYAIGGEFRRTVEMAHRQLRDLDTTDSYSADDDDADGYNAHRRPTQDSQTERGASN
jgi:hypothetical protein